MRHLFLSVVLSVVATLSGAALAQSGDTSVIYDAPTQVNLGGRPVMADIVLTIDEGAMARGTLHVALITDVTKFIAETEQDLENWVAANQERCGQRWSAGAPEITFPASAIRFALSLELELWNCGWNGKGEPGRMAREGGNIDVTLDPYIEDGKLQAHLKDFTIDERKGLSRYLPLETMARAAVNRELNKLNENKMFYRAPSPFVEEGFVYEDLDGKVVTTSGGERVIITARYVAKGDRAKLDRLVARIRREGIKQEKNKK